METFNPLCIPAAALEQKGVKDIDQEDLLCFAQASCEADYQALHAAYPRLTNSKAFLEEVGDGDLSSYEAASCVMAAAFKLGDFLRGEGLLEEFEARYLAQNKAYEVLSENEGGCEIALRMIHPLTYVGDPSKVLQPITYESVSLGEDQLADIMPPYDFDEASVRGDETHVFVNTVIRMRLPECSYVDDFANEVARRGNFKVFYEYELDGSPVLCLKYVIDFLQDMDLRKVLEYALDGLITPNMRDVCAYTYSGGREGRKAESSIASLWWTLVDTLRDGRLGCCAACGRPFIATNERGKKRRYCGNACKAYAHKYQGKKRQAYWEKSQSKATDNAS